MNKKLIAVAVVILLIAGGAGAYLLTKDSDKDKAAQENTQNGGDSSGFNAVSTAGLPFALTFTTTGGDGDSNATIEYNGQDRWRYHTEQDGQVVEYISTADAFYNRLGDQGWFKYPKTADSDSGFDTSTYQYDDADLAALQASAHYKGRQSCPAGTCDVWETAAEGSSTTIYLDSDSRRISQVVTVTGGTTTTMTYDYHDVTIDLPTDAQELPTSN